MEEVEINLDFSKTSGLVQTLSPKIQMCMLSQHYQGLHVPIICKDYLQEFVATEIDGISRTIYGFTSEKTNLLFVGDTFNLAVVERPACNYSISDEMLNGVLSLLHKFEDSRGFQRTEAIRAKCTEKGPKGVVFKSDIKWLDKPVFVSFYGLLIRIGMNYNCKDDIESYLNSFTNLDSKTVCSSEDIYKSMRKEHVPFYIYLINGGDISQTWKEYLEEDPSEKKSPFQWENLHGNSGIVSYFNQHGNSIENIKKSLDKVQTSNKKPASIA